MLVFKRIQISEHGLMKFVHLKNSKVRKKIAKNKNLRDDEKVKIAKTRYIQDQNFDAYQKVLRAISHRYLLIN